LVQPFRFGVSARETDSAADWIERARRAEQLGYSTFLVADHLVSMPSPFTALAVAAVATSHIKVGTFVLNNDFRHPVIVAREAATLDMLSGGRFELGLGAGHMRSEYEEIGLPYDAAAVRVERLEEAVRIIKALLAGEEVTFEGAHYRVTRHRGWPPASQQPRLPILIGGHGRRLLSLAAREADIVGLTGFTARVGGTRPDPTGFFQAGLEERLSLVQSEAGRRFQELELNVLVQRVVVTEDRERVVRELVERRPEVPAKELLRTPFMLFGTHDELIEQILGFRRQYGLSYFAVFDAYMEALAPVVARLADA
jgi:probable F420-dependent oxidoreductase